MRRVKIPSHRSSFHRGARTGTILSIGDLIVVGEAKTGTVKIARVLLDGEPGRVILVDLADCIPLIEGEKNHAG